MNCDAGTPRSLSALGPFLSQLAHDNDEISLRRRSRRSERKRAGLVTIFDVCQLLPFSRDLASSYQHLSSPVDRQALCLENERKALSMNFTRVAQTWQTAAIVSKYVTLSEIAAAKYNRIASLQSGPSDEQNDEDDNWIHYHPLGSRLINTMYVNLN